MNRSKRVISLGWTQGTLAGASILAVLLTLPALPAWSDSFAFNIGADGSLGTLDLGTGTLTQVGNSGITPAGLGEIGSTLFTAAYSGTGLYRVNTLTGDLTQISSLGLNGAGFNTVGSTTGGLFALDNSFNLYSVNPTTGVATLLGPTGVATGVVPGSYGFSLSTGSSTLYFEDDFDLYSINTATGRGTLIGQSGVAGIGFNSLVSENGTLYGVESSDTLPYNTLYTINTSTGVGALDATLNPDVAVGSWGLAPEFATPEPRAIMLVLIGFALLILGKVRFRVSPLIAILVLLPTSRLASEAASVIILPPATATVGAASLYGFEELQAPPASLPIRAISEGLNAGAEAVATGGFDPAVATSASVSSSGGRASATAGLTYYMEVTGPIVTSVKVDLATSLTSSSSSSSSYTSAQLTIKGPTGSLVQTCSLTQVCASGSNHGITLVVLEPDVVYQVQLASEAAVFVCTEPGDMDCEPVSAAAAVDPIFTIDPSNPDASQYSIETSSNLETSAPEPQTWMLGLICFLLIYVIQQKSKRDRERPRASLGVGGGTGR